MRGRNSCLFVIEGNTVLRCSPEGSKRQEGKNEGLPLTPVFLFAPAGRQAPAGVQAQVPLVCLFGLFIFPSHSEILNRKLFKSEPLLSEQT
jgi:hypothetical protein